ncbi:MAG: putative methyltransferase, type 11 [Ramlibacter sp.]|jgi:SAM-dependent methyltransferase|nr:putative methyltransferase, type 11 [Ramlibacter sp.]
MPDPADSINLRAVLACGFCGQNLQVQGDGSAQCAGCGQRYARTAAGTLDLRLQRSKARELCFELGTPLAVDPSLRIEPLVASSAPQVDFTGIAVPQHVTPEFMSYFPKAREPGSLMLDLGCGQAPHRVLAERAGFEWVGMDYDEASRATLLGDAHALPFRDESFEFVLSLAALHLFRFPWVVANEVHRVLKPGGLFLGTVAFLEPFHDGGYFHHTHLGALNLLQHAGFAVQRLAPSQDWTGLQAQASMALFPRMPRPLTRAVMFPVEALHKLWWRAGRLVTRNPNAAEDARIRNTTAAFAFVAAKAA